MDRGTHNNICNKQEAEDEVTSCQEPAGNIALDVLTDMMHKVVNDVENAEETQQISKSIQNINLNNFTDKAGNEDAELSQGELLKVTADDTEPEQGEILEVTTEEHNYSSAWDSSITDDEIEVICKHSSPYVATSDIGKIPKTETNEEMSVANPDIQGAMALDTSNECGEPQTQSIMYMSQQYNVSVQETPATYLGSEWGGQMYNNQVQPTQQDGSLIQHLPNGLPPQFMQQQANPPVNNGFQYSSQGTPANQPVNNGFPYSSPGTQANPPVNNGFQYSSQGTQGNTWATWTTPLDYNPQNSPRPQNAPQHFWSSNASFVSGNNDFQTPPPPPPPPIPPTFPEFHSSVPNQFDFPGEPSSFIYPSIYVSHAGLITVLLKDDISVEMLVDRTIRLVSHNRQMAIALSSKGNMSSIFHPIIKLLQNGTAMDIDIGGVQAKMTTRDIQFANEMNCFKFDYTQIEPATPNFNDLSKDSSVNLLFSSEGYGQNLVSQCLDLASKAEYENLPKGGVIVRINGVKITRRARGEITVETGPKCIKLSPHTGMCQVQTQFLEVSINQDRSVTVRRDVHSLMAANGRVVLSNGCIEAGFDEHSRLKVLSLPRRSPLPVGVKRQRRPGGSAGTRRKATALGGMP